MNTVMWDHPATQRNRQWIMEMNRFKWVEPISKRLACGDVGVGGLAETIDIMTTLENLYSVPQC